MCTLSHNKDFHFLHKNYFPPFLPFFFNLSFTYSLKLILSFFHFYFGLSLFCSLSLTPFHYLCFYLHFSLCIPSLFHSYSYNNLSVSLSRYHPSLSFLLTIYLYFYLYTSLWLSHFPNHFPFAQRWLCLCLMRQKFSNLKLSLAFRVFRVDSPQQKSLIRL